MVCGWCGVAYHACLTCLARWLRSGRHLREPSTSRGGGEPPGARAEQRHRQAGRHDLGAVDMARRCVLCRGAVVNGSGSSWQCGTGEGLWCRRGCLTGSCAPLLAMCRYQGLAHCSGASLTDGACVHCMLLSSVADATFVPRAAGVAVRVVCHQLLGAALHHPYVRVAASRPALVGGGPAWRVPVPADEAVCGRQQARGDDPGGSGRLYGEPASATHPGSNH